tara:strand:- start:29 stop:448 length:420 start_codon:yes stop_codon:yes gene_type:complete
MFGCEGPTGPAGKDGVFNIYTEIIELTEEDFDLIDIWGYGYGFIEYSFSSPLITQDVIENGMVFVDMSWFEPYNWNSMPLMYINGDDSDVNWIMDGWYIYSEGELRIRWDMSSDYNWSEWLSVSMYWDNYYKITIISPL